MSQRLFANAIAMIICILLLVIPLGSAKEFHIVGAPVCWRRSPEIQSWATTKKFHVGDALVFIYDAPTIVLEVGYKAFLDCDAHAYLRKYVDQQTVLELKRTGPHYFISTYDDCLAGLKLAIHVDPELKIDYGDRNHQTRSRSMD
ncbi:hypothetical protein LWI29_006830 [Acer saccharum]|uniref:Phytocyanin domain-containing protein n=1 Tax=Acer saccharum TaxID=4024 RepID=A0AA39TDM2_ACESA|nr:hypothetical protein LWI29_006830 [Acer saccharum]